MNQLASILIVMTLTISISQCVVCHDESANVNNTGRLTNERPLIRPVFDQRNTYSPKDRFDNDKIIFDLPSHEATTVPAEIKDRYGNGSGSGSENGIGNGFGSKANDPDQQYYSKANGEYQFRYFSSHLSFNFENFCFLFTIVLVLYFQCLGPSSLKIRNGIRHVESGEYEERNGQPVFIIRGFFEHITKDVIAHKY